MRCRLTRTEDLRAPLQDPLEGGWAGPRPPISPRWSNDNNYIGYACAFNSQGDVEILLHATGEAGLHFIDLYPAIDKGKET